MPGTATRSPGRTSPGRNSSLTTMSPASQCLPTTRDSVGGAVGGAGGERGGVVGVVEGGADVVAHPAVDGDVGAAGAAVEGDLLDGADLVDRAHRRADDRAAGLDGQARERDAEGPALVLDDLGHLGGQLRGVGRVVLGRVGDAEAAAEVHLGHLDAELVGRPGRAARAPGGRRPRSPRCRRSGCRCGSAGRAARRPGGRRARGVRPRGRRRWRSRSRTSGPRGRWRCTRACGPRRRRSPAPSPAPSRPSSAATSASRSISCEGVDDDPADAELDGALELAEGLVVAVEADPLHREAGPLARRPARRRSRRRGESPSSASHRATVGAEERLARVVDVVVGEGVAEGAGAGAEVGLVEDVRRGAVLATSSGSGTPPTLRTPSAFVRRPRPEERDERVGVGRLTQPVRPAQRAVARGPSRTGVRWARPITSARGRRRRAGRARWRAPCGRTARARAAPRWSA